MAFSALAPLLFASESRADDFVFGGGLFVSFAFGQHLGVGWGGEVFSNTVVVGSADSCSSDTRAGLGPTLQLSTVGLEAPRLMVGVQGGGEIDDARVFALSGELGGIYRFGERSGLGLQLGLVGSAPLSNLFFRGAFGLDEYTLGGGVRVTNELGYFGSPGVCVEGRPLRGADGGCHVPQAPERVLDRERSPGRPDEHDLYSELWGADAAHEQASVPAFLQLASELLALAAPEPLVARALAAASDEVRHAFLCARLASAYAAQEVRPNYPLAARRPTLAGEAGALRLAFESWVDGCLGEGAAAARAARAASRATVPEVRSAQRRIASDERAHAELAFSVVSWLGFHPVYGKNVRALLGSLRHEVPFSPAPRRALPRDASSHGRLSSNEIDDLTCQTHARAIARLETSWAC